MEEMLSAFQALGHETLLVGPPSFASARFGHDPKLLSRFRARIPKAIYELLEIGYNIPAYFRLRRAWREFRPDFIYERHNLYFLAGTWLKKRVRIPLLLEVNAPLARERGIHGGLGLPKLAASLERRVWRSADMVLPVTHVLAAQMETAGVSQRRTEVIGNAIDPSKFSHNASIAAAAKHRLGMDGKVVLGFTGFVRDWHGLDSVIDRLASPDLHDTHLIVVGDGPALPDLKAQAARLGVSDRILFAGLVDRDRVGVFVASFDIALQPKCVEYASPLKLFEYMALGKAIVAPAQPNIREVLEDERTALLFDPANAAAMFAAVKRLIDDEGLRTRLGAAAAAAIHERGFTWRRNAARVAALGAQAHEIV